MPILERLVRATREFWRELWQSMPDEMASEDAQPLSVTTERIGDADEPIGGFQMPPLGQLGFDLPPINKRERVVESVPLLDDQTINVVRAAKQIRQLPDGTISTTTRTQPILRADDGMAVREAADFFQCPGCHVIATLPSTYTCVRCQRRYCRNSTCRRELSIDNQILDVCPECARRHGPGLFQHRIARALFEY